MLECMTLKQSEFEAKEGMVMLMQSKIEVTDYNLKLVEVSKERASRARTALPNQTYDLQ